jgi:hypothetical protein
MSSNQQPVAQASTSGSLAASADMDQSEVDLKARLKALLQSPERKFRIGFIHPDLGIGT